jgi:SAM-dependent methyltransferase
LERLDGLFRQKYGDPEKTGWAPRQRRSFGYYLPADIYEALVSGIVVPGTAWIDVGGGHQIFPENPALARALVSRCSRMIAVDPSANVHRNQFAHERIQSPIEEFQTIEQFDLATLRMVAEHVENPAALVSTLHRLVRAGGHVVVFTVNRWSPITMVSHVTPFWLHHPIKSRVWGGVEEDTFPVRYLMNTRRSLGGFFDTGGFIEVLFAKLDDLTAFGRFRLLNIFELLVWRLLRSARLPYPETCLLGVYERR